MGKFFTPTCLKHKWKLKEVIEPNAYKQIDGKKIFVCSKCARVKTVLTPWNKIEQGGYY